MLRLGRGGVVKWMKNWVGLGVVELGLLWNGRWGRVWCSVEMGDCVEFWKKWDVLSFKLWGGVYTGW